MTRTQHYSHPTKAFPVYCLDWTDDGTVLLGGGGGASRSGIGNKFKLCKVSSDGRRVEQLYEHALSNEEDAPMTLALDRDSSKFVTGINTSEANVREGLNKQCRVFEYNSEALTPLATQGTIQAEWSDDYPYQKLTALSGKGKDDRGAEYVAVGTTDNKVSIMAFPSLSIVVEPFDVEGGDLVDLSWGGPQGTWLAVTSAAQMTVYSFDLKLKLLQSVPAPKVEDAPVAFRAARFGRGPENTTSPCILAVLNSTAPIKRGAKRQGRKAYIVKFDASVSEEQEPSQDKVDEKEPAAVQGIRWDLAVKREVASKPVTVFDVSSNGQLVCFGCSDLSIGMLDAKTLSPLLKILHAHSFPPTALKFNPSATLLVSASADNTIRTVVVPQSFGGVSSSIIMIIIALLAVIIALLMRH